MSELTQSFVRECFDYNPDTGVLRWKMRPKNHFPDVQTYNSFVNNVAGKQAGTTVTCKKKSYVVVKIGGRKHRVHRIIFLHVTGVLPCNEVDHINGDGTDNRWCNLRDVQKAVNAKNHRIREDNSSGVAGLYMRSPSSWQAFITVNGEKFNQFFRDKFEAICWRKSQEVIQGFHENHGTMRGYYVTC